jgi:hypothetical protein
MTEPNYINPAPGIWIDTGWRDIASAPRDENAPVLILQDGRRFVCEWDEASGYFFSLYALDGVKEFTEFPGRMYGAKAWHPWPIAPYEKPATNIAPEPGTLITGERDCVYNGQGTPEDALR